jgi:hypothetical protein
MSARCPELASLRLLKLDGRWWIVSKFFHAGGRSGDRPQLNLMTTGALAGL